MKQKVMEASFRSEFDCGIIGAAGAYLSERQSLFIHLPKFCSRQTLVLFSRRFTSVKRSTKIVNFSFFILNMIKFTSNRFKFNKVGQIDGLGDTNCIIVSKLSKNFEKYCDTPLALIFSQFMWPKE